MDSLILSFLHYLFCSDGMGDSPGWDQNSINRSNSTSMGPMNPMDEMMRNMDFLMRQQMMLQMSVMYSNMTNAWQQNNLHRNAPTDVPSGMAHSNPGNFGITPGAGNQPAIGFNPQSFNNWWPNNAVAPAMSSFGDVNTGLEITCSHV